MTGFAQLILGIGPFAELVAFAAVASWIGIADAILLQLGFSVLGILVLRVFAASPLRDLQRAMAMNEPPAGPMLRTACVLAGGVLLIVPGFLTDLLGLVLILPGPRSWIGRWIWSLQHRPVPQANVVEGQWREVDLPQIKAPTDPS